MLTVKIIKPNGHEEILEASEVTKERNGIFVRGGSDQRCEFYGPRGDRYSYDWDGRDLPLGGAEPRADDDYAAVYIMNRYGSTVSTYQI